MQRLRPWIWWVWIVSFASLAFAAPKDSSVVHVKLEGPLDISMCAHLARGVRQAKASGSPLLIEIDTPGGEIELMWSLQKLIDSASADGVETTAWIHSHALSAGSLLALSCDRVYMTGTAVIGAAKPVSIGADGGIAPISDVGVREKIDSAMRATFRASAERHHRSPVLAEAMVDSSIAVVQVRVDGALVLWTQSEYDDARMRGVAPEFVRTVCEKNRLLSLSANEAVELGIADGVSDKLEELVQRLGLPNAQIIPVERLRSENLIALIDSYKYVLLAIAIMAAIVEFKSPGFGIAGVISIACFALYLVGQYLVGIADVWEIVAICIGLVLVAVEIFLMPGTLWPGIVGAVLVAVGLAAISAGRGFHWEYALDRRLLLDAVFKLALGVTLAIVGAMIVSRFLPHTPGVRRMVLAPAAGEHSGGAVPEASTTGDERVALGSRGVAVTDLRPVGKVVLDARADRELEARAEGEAIDRGARVRVIEVSAGRLVVERDARADEARSG